LDLGLRSLEDNGLRRGFDVKSLPCQQICQPGNIDCCLITYEIAGLSTCFGSVLFSNKSVADTGFGHQQLGF
jgi:hypothetical protein